MNLFNWLFDCFQDDDDQTSMFQDDDDQTYINPATGLLMMGGIGGIDTAGNPYGVDWSESCDSSDSAGDCWDDGFSSSDCP